MPELNPNLDIPSAFNSESLTETLPLHQAAHGPNALIVYGGGGHGKAVIDLVRSLYTFEIVGIVDDGLPVGSQVLGVPVLGGGEILGSLVSRGVRLAANAIGGIGNITPRVEVFDKLKAAGFDFPVLVHPSAVVEPSARLAVGVQIFPHAYVGSDAEIGFGSILNIAALAPHDCVLEEVVNLSPGVLLAGRVHIGKHTLIGMGVTINLDLNIGANVRIGNGATIKADVPDGGVVRAGHIWPE